MAENNSSPNAYSKFFLQAPAPWQLEGEGIILVYKFSRDWVEKFGQLPPNLQGKFTGGIGYLMLLNYKNSPVGPYHELLLIPGKFSPTEKQTITKIYVDSEASTQNGRVNWGISKETLGFTWTQEKGKTSITVISEGGPVFSCEVSTFGISMPISTSILPINLHQELNQVNFYTKPTATGWSKLANVKINDLDPKYLPDLRQQKLLFAVKVHPFRVNFPIPNHKL